MSQRKDLLNNKKVFSWLEDIKTVNCISEKTVDILIIGAGHAGTAAARSAIEANSANHVMVVEQQERNKQWILGNGEIGHINSRWQEEAGVPKVDVDEFVNDWQLRTNNRSNYQLIKKYAEKCGSCFDWMIEVLSEGERKSIYPMLAKPSPNMPRALNGIKAYPGTAKMPVLLQNIVIKKNQELAEVKGVQFYFGTEAYQLITKDNRVTGAIIKDKKGYHQINIKKGVILAAGDYSKNEQMCRDLLTESADLIDQGTDWIGHGWNGDGLRLGMLAGGRMEPRSHAAMGGNYSLPGFEVIGSTAVLRVNKYGERYSNEGFGTHILAALAGAKQPNGMLYGVFDDNILEQLTYQTNCHAIVDYCDDQRVEALKQILKQAREAGSKGLPISPIKGSETRSAPRILYTANTLKELAACMFNEGDIQKTFLETVQQYNHMCRQGKDTEFGKEVALLHGILKPPFYAVGQLKDSTHPIGQSLKILVTVSGLLIDKNQQVLNDDFEPIEGLFATGNSSGCRFGAQYTTAIAGQSISVAQTLGREVGSYLSTVGEEEEK